MAVLITTTPQIERKLAEFDEAIEAFRTASRLYGEAVIRDDSRDAIWGEVEETRARMNEAGAALRSKIEPYVRRHG